MRYKISKQIICGQNKGFPRWFLSSLGRRDNLVQLKQSTINEHSSRAFKTVLDSTFSKFAVQFKIVRGQKKSYIINHWLLDWSILIQYHVRYDDTWRVPLGTYGVQYQKSWDRPPEFIPKYFGTSLHQLYSNPIDSFWRKDWENGKKINWSLSIQ